MNRYAMAIGVLLAASAPVSGAFAFGGITGGGGNFLRSTPPSRPQSPLQMKFVVERSRAELGSLLNRKNEALRAGQLSKEEQEIFEPIFQANPNVFDQMARVPLRVVTTRPCHNAFGGSVDGSIRDSEKGSVCISAYDLARKVDREQASQQAAALLAHEYSELTGFDEDQAVSLQRMILDEAILAK